MTALLFETARSRNRNHNFHFKNALCRALLAILVVLPLAAIDANAQKWLTAWSVSHGERLTTPAMGGTSVRMIVRPAMSGTMVRIKLENTLGQSPVEFSAAYIARVQSGASLAPGSSKRIRFGKHPSLILAPGEGTYSNPVAFKVEAFQRYAISLEVKSASDISAHLLGLVTNYVATGAHASDASPSAFAPVPNGDLGAGAGPTFPFYWVAALDVASSSAAGAIVGFGDSITDGRCTTRTENGGANGVVLPDLYQRWPDLLSTRLAGTVAAKYPKVVTNEGISGNRILSGGSGPPALVRMDRDVIDRKGVTHVIFFEGSNDIASGASAAAVIDGVQQVIDRAHAANLKIVGATVIPRGGSAAWTNSMEQQRVAVNVWIRHHANFDGLIDFDALMQGPVNSVNNAVVIQPKWSCFDGIHPNSAGYAAMAASIDPNLFKKIGE